MSNTLDNYPSYAAYTLDARVDRIVVNDSVSVRCISVDLIKKIRIAGAGINEKCVVIISCSECIQIRK